MPMQSSRGGMIPPNRNDNGVAAELSEPGSSPRTVSRTTIILWLVVVGMMFFFLPLYVVSATVREDTRNLEADLSSMRLLLTTVPTARPEIQRVLTPLAQTQAQINQLKVVHPTLIAPRPDLPIVMTAIGKYNPNDIMLTSLTLENNRITLNGRAAHDEHGIGYVHTLEQSNLFTRVMLQSMQMTAPITSTLALTPAPKRATEAGSPPSMPMRFIIILELKAVAP